MTGSASWRAAQQAPSTFCVSQSLIRSWKKEESQYPIPRSVQPGSGGPSQPGRRSAASVVISEFVSPVMLLGRSESCPPSEYIWGLVGVLEYAASQTSSRGSPWTNELFMSPRPTGMQCLAGPPPSGRRPRCRAFHVELSQSQHAVLWPRDPDRRSLPSILLIAEMRLALWTPHPLLRGRSEGTPHAAVSCAMGSTWPVYTLIRRLHPNDSRPGWPLATGHSLPHLSRRVCGQTRTHWRRAWDGGPSLSDRR